MTMIEDRTPTIPKAFPRPDVPLDRQIQEALAPLGVHVDRVAIVSRPDSFVTVVLKGALLTQSMYDAPFSLPAPSTQILTIAPEPKAAEEGQ